MGTRGKLEMFKFFTIILIAINIFFASHWVLDGNIFFHTDIARDFLLIEDIVENKNLTLIGPRSGAIPGVFHGPLWLYLNIPAFMIGQGNPVIVGWFWVALYLLSLLIIYQVGRNMFGEKVGLLSALLLSTTTALLVRSLFNPYGALLLAPLYFYTLINYLKKKKFKLLVFSIFILGLIIQFQMAFGIPIAILTVLYLIYFLYKQKKLKDLFALSVLLIPLSTFVVFDIRNRLLQINSVISYLSGAENHGKLRLDFIQLLKLRLHDATVGNLGELTSHETAVTILLLAFFFLAFYRMYKQKSSTVFHLLLIYFFVGFWIMALIFQGPIWNYYYLPFIPLLILLFCSLYETINKFLFYILLSLILFFNFGNNFKEISSYNSQSSAEDVSTWKFNLEMAEEVYKDSQGDFGYYIFTPDLYGYSPRYAMNYYQKNTPGKKVFPYKKKPLTYLLISPPPEYGKDPNSLWYQRNVNKYSWKQNDVKITREANSVINFNNGFIIEKYLLSPEEVKIEPNPYLIQSIFFR